MKRYSEAELAAMSVPELEEALADVGVQPLKLAGSRATGWYARSFLSSSPPRVGIGPSIQQALADLLAKVQPLVVADYTALETRARAMLQDETRTEIDEERAKLAARETERPDPAEPNLGEAIERAFGGRAGR